MSRGSRGVRVANWWRVSRVQGNWQCPTYELDELNGHPVVAALNQEVEKPGGQGQKVLWSSPS